MPNRPTESVAGFNVDVGRLAQRVVDVLLDPEVFTERQFETLFYTFVGHMSGAEIAKHIGTSKSSVNLRRVRAYEILREHVPELEEHIDWVGSFAGRPSTTDNENEDEWCYDFEEGEDF